MLEQKEYKDMNQEEMEHMLRLGLRALVKQKEWREEAIKESKRKIIEWKTYIIERENEIKLLSNFIESEKWRNYNPKK